jgi:copper oxidase (laccase) domain-containing protein
VAAIHSGWRGTVADIVGATVAVLAGDGVAPADLVAAIGPCIEVEAFEVGEEVAREFAPEFVRRSPGSRPHVDLVATVRAQLVAAGVPSDSIERVGGCTWAHPELYFSYRRDGAGIGQMLAFVGFAPA